ncbi:MAG: glycerophosphodiester phosphodiesterase [Betaproteobacteria bacterium]|nr:glycerophosphodiester phosphodiesterase [Betaproteobacteria bacterium]NDC70651.1 glycerophosphodiester phosphodiesterase [Betaproteobacteria bacterium]
MNSTFFTRRSLLKPLGVSMLSALAAVRAPTAQPASRTAERAYQRRWVDLQGHRGAAGLIAENTLPSFARALAIGVNTLELDIVMTKDDVIVISHDPDLNPDITRGPDGMFLQGRGPRIIDLTYSALQQYQVGALNPKSRYASRYPDQQPMEDLRIPRLSDLFDWVQSSGAHHIRFAIETKVSPLRPSFTPPPELMVDALLDLIARYRLNDRVQVLSFDWRSLQRVQRLAPGVQTVYLTTAYPSINNLKAADGSDSAWTAGFQLRQFHSIPHMIKAAGGTHWSCSYPHLDRSQIDIAHQLGLEVLAWTVDEIANMEQMLDIEVDGLVTNRPDRAIGLLKARGQYRSEAKA